MSKIPRVRDVTQKRYEISRCKYSRFFKEKCFGIISEGSLITIELMATCFVSSNATGKKAVAIDVSPRQANAYMFHRDSKSTRDGKS